MTEIPEKYRGDIFAAVYTIRHATGGCGYSLTAVKGTPDVFANLQTQYKNKNKDHRIVRNFPRISEEFYFALEQEVNDLRVKAEDIDDISVDDVIRRIQERAA